MPSGHGGGGGASAIARGIASGGAGAGFGASTYDLKSGLGSASAATSRGFRIGALAVSNSVGRATRGLTHHFWAAPYERAGEFGKRNGVPGELVVRLRPTKVLAMFNMTG